MDTHRGDSSGATYNVDNNASGEHRMNRIISRSFHRRNSRGRIHARSNSVTSLDRVFDTHGSDEPSIPIATAPSLTAEEKNFIETTHGILERRDGFFDAVFLPPEDVDHLALKKQAEKTLPLAYSKKHPLSLTHFFPRQFHEAWGVIRRVATTRSGIKLTKSFLGFFIAYILCLVPATRERFGRYYYIMAISAILNHPGRTLGAQVDGTVLTVLGTLTGLGWGAVALWVSTATTTAQATYGAILGAFLFVFIFVIACLRSYYIRTYQFVICAGIAISYTCLAEISGTEVTWIKLLNYGIPWLIGQAINLVICSTVIPDAGSRPLAVGLNQIFNTMLDGIPPVRDSVRIRRRLVQAFVSMSQVHRDLTIDFSITKLHPKDVLMLRNSVQAVIRTLLSLKTEIRLSKPSTGEVSDQHDSSHQELAEFVIDMDKNACVPCKTPGHREIVDFVTNSLATPTEDLLQSMKFALRTCNAALMDICGHRRYLGPPYDVSSDLSSALANLREHITAFDSRQNQVLSSERLLHTCARSPDVLKIFAFSRPIHQASTAIEALVNQLDEVQQRQPKHFQFHLPGYPIRKAIHRTNPQVRHDRGGVTAGSYFRSLNDIAKMIERIKSREFRPVSRKGTSADNYPLTSVETMTADDLTNDSNSRETRLRHRIWALLHRLQGFETRFGLKTALVTTLLALPGYLSQSHAWWERYEGWWSVVMGWLILGPRTGGNVQDLFARSFCAILGSLWAGLAFAASNGNPYIMAVFAAIFMLPMMYRYTQSTHPRSGLVGCIAFTVISLSEINLPNGNPRDEIQSPVNGVGQPTVARVLVIRAAAMVFGVVVAILINWTLWPFVARHDLRKGLASMIFNCSIVYRSTISRYVYYEEGNVPTKSDIEASEILEGRLREGFVRLRQLLALTRHEIRLRAPFDPLPYSALISACEQFFDHLVTVRQSSVFYHPNFIGGKSEAAMELLAYRRDEIATVLTLLYTLSGALRANRPVPKYLPNAAVARKRLLDRMLQLERKHSVREKYSTEESRKASTLGRIYSYSFNDSLTGCVEQVKQLEKYTKIVVGEQGIDCDYMVMNS
ncbi:hypothetical protein F4808DRAFT_417238 [Astrocystis sublimbata]|nr:hypothetical protein F4808DRAFT_417238 [Astrocystis sublimbata]